MKVYKAKLPCDVEAGVNNVFLKKGTIVTVIISEFSYIGISHPSIDGHSGNGNIGYKLDGEHEGHVWFPLGGEKMKENPPKELSRSLLNK